MPILQIRILRTFLTIAAITFILGGFAQAQIEYKLLYKFKAKENGNAPWAGLIFDKAGNLYGTAASADGSLNGTVFRLTPSPKGFWTKTVLYNFCSLANCADGRVPTASLSFDTAGNLYGTAEGGGNGIFCPFPDSGGCGVVFELIPSSKGTWSEQVLYNFCSLANCADGWGPGNPTLDAEGNLYGVTSSGGDESACDTFGCGVVYKLTHNSDGTWTEAVSHAFAGGADGTTPQGGLIFDQHGNLYGTTEGGGLGPGTVFEISSTGEEQVLALFSGGSDGAYPTGNLTLDSVGNLYGTAQAGGDLDNCNIGGQPGCGLVFELMAGNWTENVLFNFTPDRGSDPSGGVIFDSAGNLYGTTSSGGNTQLCGGYGCGTVFKLSPQAGAGWKQTVMHRFNNKPAAGPVAGLVIGQDGNLYGTDLGASPAPGSVFEVIKK